MRKAVNWVPIQNGIIPIKLGILKISGVDPSTSLSGALLAITPKPFWCLRSSQSPPDTNFQFPNWRLRLFSTGAKTFCMPDCVVTCNILLAVSRQPPIAWTEPPALGLIDSCLLRGWIVFGFQCPSGKHHCPLVQTSHLQQYHQLQHWLQSPDGHPEGHPLDQGKHASNAETLPRNQLRCIPRMISCQQLFSNTHTGNIMSPPFWQTGQTRDPSASGMSNPCEIIVRFLPTTWVYDSQPWRDKGIRNFAVGW